MKKRIISLLLALCMILGLAACGNSAAQNSTPPASNPSAPASENSAAPVVSNEKHKIGVANIQEGEAWEIVRTYLETVVGPTFNFEFVISEKISDSNGLIAFMEQCYAAGCDGFINMVTSNDAISQGAHKAEEWGMWFVTQNSAWVEDVADLPHNIGQCGASAEAVGEAYKAAFADVLSDGEKHSVYLFTGAAVGGDRGQGAASHFYSAKGVLEAFQEAYNLTYSQPIADIINNQNPGEVETGDPDVHIYIYPGTNPGDAVTAALPVFQSGDYDIFSGVFAFTAFTNALADVEASLGKNIKVIATAQIEAQTKTGFESKDSTGDTVLNGAVLNDLCIALGINSIELYNAFNGASEAMKDNGKTVLLGARSYAVLGADTYARVEKLNTSPELYVLTGEDLLNLTVARNPNVTWKDLEAKLVEISDLDAMLASKGL